MTTRRYCVFHLFKLHLPGRGSFKVLRGQGCVFWTLTGDKKHDHLNECQLREMIAALYDSKLSALLLLMVKKWVQNEKSTYRKLYGWRCDRTFIAIEKFQGSILQFCLITAAIFFNQPSVALVIRATGPKQAWDLSRNLFGRRWKKDLEISFYVFIPRWFQSVRCE